ncbi:hypothetical protein BDV06DRAFT_199106 [Aspergillus oleicola]
MVGIINGQLRANLEVTGMGYSKELEMPQSHWVQTASRGISFFVCRGEAVSMQPSITIAQSKTHIKMKTAVTRQ